MPACFLVRVCLCCIRAAFIEPDHDSFFSRESSTFQQNSECRQFWWVCVCVCVRKCKSSTYAKSEFPCGLTGPDCEWKITRFTRYNTRLRKTIFTHWPFIPSKEILLYFITFRQKWLSFLAAAWHSKKIKRPSALPKCPWASAKSLHKLQSSCSVTCGKLREFSFQ